MDEESVVVDLQMSASQFLTEAQKAAKATEQIGAAGKRASQDATSGMERMRKSARENASDWQAVSSHLLKVGAAQSAFGAAVAVTGGNYNRLQQTSRAALSSLLGGAREANLQMDRLDEWATKSPFSRAVWIEAQQQLLAFGVDAQKVIPYMDAIQNAVAAAGGSESHLRGITEIMAKISSSSKITAQDLNQFGNWGVNAAELIGLSMGKTGAQIREEITAGTLDAGVALDALALGMGTKFKGAAGAVKATFDGAFDRVKAAFRDLSAEVMDPFIGKEGGGLLTTLLNQGADLMRMFQRLPGPVKDFTFAFGLATTALSLGGAAFLGLVPKVLELHSSLKVLGAQGIPVISKFAASWAGVPAQLGDVFANLRGGFRSLGDSMTLASQMGVSRAQALRVGMVSAFQGIGASAKSLGAGLLGVFGGPWGLAATAAITGITMAVMDYSRKQQAANAFAKQFADTLDDVTGASTNATKKMVLDEMFDRAGAAAWQASGHMQEWVDAVARMDVSAMEQLISDQWQLARGQGAWSDAAKVMGDMEHQLRGVKLSMDNTSASSEALGEGADGLRESVDGASEGMDGLADSADGAAEAQDRYLDALKGIVDFERHRSDTYASLEAAQDKQLETLAKLTKQLEENGATLDQNTEAGRNNRAYLRDLQDGYNDVIDGMIAMTDEQGNAIYSAQQMGEETQRMRDEFIQTAMQFGATSEEAGRMADQYGLIPSQVETRAAFDNATAKAEIREMLKSYDEIPEEVHTQILAYGDDAKAVAGEVARAIEGGVPMKKITELLADGSDATEVAHTVDEEINRVKQRKAAQINALNAANPDIAKAQASMDGFKQKAPAIIKAKDEATPTIEGVRTGILTLPNKTVTITANYVQTGAVGRNMTGVAFAHGGAVFGPGGPRDDMIPAWLSNSEHVVTANEVARIGGHQNMEALRFLLRNRPGEVRSALGFADGGSPAQYAPFIPSRVPAPIVQPARVSLEGLRVEGRLSVDGRVFGDLVDARFVSGPVGGGLAGVGAASRSHGGSRPGSI